MFIATWKSLGENYRSSDERVFPNGLFEDIGMMV